MDKRKLYEIEKQRGDALKEAEKAAAEGNTEAYSKAMEKVKGFNTQIDQFKALETEAGRYDVDPGKLQEDKETPETLAKAAQLHDLRTSNEYVRAWTKAMQTGAKREIVLAREEFAPLRKAMTIGGNSGADGGYLVPEDFETKVITLAKDYVDLSKLCNVEMVNSDKGWRNVETSSARTKLTKVGEATAITKGSTPQFGRIDFSCDLYADRIEISRALFEDAEGLMQYLAEWYAPKYVNTKNDMILTALKTLTFTALAGDTDAAQVKALKSILNKGLNTAISKQASLITNASLYDIMDNWVDGQSRPILVPDVTRDFDRFKNRPVIYMDDADLAAVTIGEGETAASYYPLFVGSLKHFFTIFQRKAMEMATTDVGGDAWANASIEVRTMCRMDGQKVDENAVKYTGIAVPT